MELAPYINNFLYELLHQTKLGLSNEAIAVHDIRSGVSAIEKQVYCDRFKLAIPFANQYTICDVIFNLDYPDFVPDFVFVKSFRPDITKIDAFNTWHTQDPTSLARLVQQLFQKFKEQEICKLKNFDRLHFEYASLLEQPGMSPDRIETLINFQNIDYKAQFLIKLPIDFSKLPFYLARVCLINPTVKQSEMPIEDDNALLFVTFQTCDGNNIIPYLALSPRVLFVVGKPIEAPRFRINDCLMDYVPNICELIKNKVEEGLIKYDCRKEFIANVLSHFGRSILEFDMVSYKYISLLLEHEDFHFILKMYLNNDFPNVKPTLILRSIYHITNDKKPFTKTIRNYPYSRKLGACEIVVNIKNFLVNYIDTFKLESMELKS